MLSSSYADRAILVTGGTGSFGSTMVRHLTRTSVREVRVLSRDEAKQDEMRRQLSDRRVRFFLGDVRDYESVLDAVRGVDHIFHAAALKQVPSCEFFPMQAVRTNVQGSRNVIEAADACGVASVVCLSTDKAVYPINAMGMSKALMEKVVQAFARNKPGSPTVVSVTRYGNVLCSRGSVIPLFVQQLRSGGPITVTDPDMTRFLMSLDESVSLVDYAFGNAAPGDLFVRKAPACTIGVLARAVADLLDVESPEIKVIGTRHGEKPHETLLGRTERIRADEKADYYRVPLDARSLEYELFFEDGTPDGTVPDYTSHNTERLGLGEVVDLLRDLPEFRRLRASDPR